MSNRTPESIISDYLYDPDVRKPQETAEQDAKAIIENLKYEGFIVIKADTLVQRIGLAMVGKAYDGD